MSKVTLSGHISVPETELPAIREALAVHIEATRAEPGCITFVVTENPKELGRFDVYEEFESKAAFEAHQKRVRTSAWGTLSKNASRRYQVEGIAE